MLSGQSAFRGLLFFFAVVLLQMPGATALEVAGVTVTPHLKAEVMRYRHNPEPAVGARVQLFLVNDAKDGTPPLTLDAASRVLVNGRAPKDWLSKGNWAWHDLPDAAPAERQTLPAGAMTVWSFNGRTAEFGPGGQLQVEAGPSDAPWLREEMPVAKPSCWLSAVTFLGPETAIQPNEMWVHIANASPSPVEIRACRLWLPRDPATPRVLYPQQPLLPLEPFGGQASIPGGDRGGFMVKTDPLPLTYAVIEVQLARGQHETVSCWAYLRIKPERFDISGGWVNTHCPGKGSTLSDEVFLKALTRLYVNTAHLGLTKGYSDTALYEKHPLKYFGPLSPLGAYDNDSMLLNVHGIECLGEPQYGGGRPVPPQEVWEKLHPYAASRLATTITHSEERIWRDYAGLSDFPHYDAYRVTAPSADAWRKYERWGKKRIGWGAPLETIGDMCRSLRELNRPMPCAIWSQGPHDGWEVYGGRKRVSPTPDEIRVQAYHALSSRITSLYWFNLSLKSLVHWRDTLDELGRLGREIRMLDQFLLEGDAYAFQRLRKEDGKLDWDLASVCGPHAGLLFALDLDYQPDAREDVFKFGAPRASQWHFQLPAYLRDIKDVFRLDADGVHDTQWSVSKGGVEIRGTVSRVAVYVAAPDSALRARIEQKRQQLIAAETSLQFDPARNDADFQQLEQLLAACAQGQ